MMTTETTTRTRPKAPITAARRVFGRGVSGANEPTFYRGDKTMALFVNHWYCTTYVDRPLEKGPSQKKRYFQTNLTLGKRGNIGKMTPPLPGVVRGGRPCRRHAGACRRHEAGWPRLFSTWGLHDSTSCPANAVAPAGAQEGREFMWVLRNGVPEARGENSHAIHRVVRVHRTTSASPGGTPDSRVRRELPPALPGLEGRLESQGWRPGLTSVALAGADVAR